MASKKLSDYYSCYDNIKDYTNIEEKTKVEDKVDIENVETKEVTKEVQLTDNELNETVEVRYGNDIYITWTVKLISPLITKFLKGIYPDSLIVRGLTDIVVFDRKTEDIVPTEIQRTPLDSNNRFAHHVFEDSIRRQIEQNIELSGKCWLFMDSEYLRYLQLGRGNKSINISINMIWLVELMKENTLKVFVIKYNGVVRELITKDFDFLKDVSQTCPLGCENDERVLNRNKLKIKRNVLFGYNFTQEEISQFESDFDNRIDNEIKMSNDYFKKNNDKKCKLYGNVLEAIGNLPNVNNIISCTKSKNNRIYYAVTLGLLYQNEFDGHNKNARIQFVDKFNIAQYFPGYLRNKEMWDYCKEKKRVFTIDEFRGIVEGREHCLKLLKNQSTQHNLEDYK